MPPLPSELKQQVDSGEYRDALKGLSRVLDLMRRNTYVLATGVHDQCWSDNENLARVLRDKGVPVRLEVWGDNTGHDWPWWQRMAQTYL